jgi:hypothetical protein
MLGMAEKSESWGRGVEGSLERQRKGSLRRKEWEGWEGEWESLGQQRRGKPEEAEKGKPWVAEEGDPGIAEER